MCTRLEAVRRSRRRRCLPPCRTSGPAATGDRGGAVATARRGPPVVRAGRPDCGRPAGLPDLQPDPARRARRVGPAAGQAAAGMPRRGRRSAARMACAGRTAGSSPPSRHRARFASAWPRARRAGRRPAGPGGCGGCAWRHPGGRPAPGPIARSAPSRTGSRRRPTPLFSRCRP